MKRHIIGFAIFLVIVGSAVLVHSMFRTFRIPVDAIEINFGDDKKYACDINERISYRIISAEYELTTGRFISEIEMEWNGESPPETVYMSLFLHGNDHAPYIWTIASKVVDRPFATGSRHIAVFSLNPNTAAKFRDLNNIYAYVDFARDGKFPSTHEERMQKMRYIPVLKVH